MINYVVFSIFMVDTYLSVRRLRFHLPGFTNETRTTFFILDISEVSNQQDNAKHNTERTNNQKCYIFGVIVLRVIWAHKVGGDGQEQKHPNSNQYPTDQDEWPMEPSRISDVIQSTVDQAIWRLWPFTLLFITNCSWLVNWAGCGHLDLSNRF